jgi:hypothetical protein
MCEATYKLNPGVNFSLANTIPRSQIRQNPFGISAIQIFV